MGKDGGVVARHYLNQCWPFISEVLCHSPENMSTSSAQGAMLYNDFGNYTLISLSRRPGANELMLLMPPYSWGNKNSNWLYVHDLTETISLTMKLVVGFVMYITEARFGWLGSVSRLLSDPFLCNYSSTCLARGSRQLGLLLYFITVVLLNHKFYTPVQRFNIKTAIP